MWCPAIASWRFSWLAGWPAGAFGINHRWSGWRTRNLEREPMTCTSLQSDHRIVIKRFLANTRLKQKKKKFSSEIQAEKPTLRELRQLPLETANADWVLEIRAEIVRPSPCSIYLSRRRRRKLWRPSPTNGDLYIHHHWPPTGKNGRFGFSLVFFLVIVRKITKIYFGRR